MAMPSRPARAHLLPEPSRAVLPDLKKIGPFHSKRRAILAYAILVGLLARALLLPICFTQAELFYPISKD